MTFTTSQKLAVEIYLALNKLISYFPLSFLTLPSSISTTFPIYFTFHLCTLPSVLRTPSLLFHYLHNLSQWHTANVRAKVRCWSKRLTSCWNYVYITPNEINTELDYQEYLIPICQRTITCKLYNVISKEKHVVGRQYQTHIKEYINSQKLEQ